MKYRALILSSIFFSSLGFAEVFFSSNKTDHSIEVPEIGSGVGLLDEQKETKVGEKVYRKVHRQLPVLKNPWLEDQLLYVFSNILSQTQLSAPIGLVILNDPQINAFAVPGGLFALNTGLIASAKNIDEVAGVMAHEVAHVTQRHYSRSQETFKGQGLLALAGLIAGVAIASQADGEAGTAVILGTQAALMDQQLTYSRNQEREADRIGMQLMYSAGYNPQSMADYFETMHRATSRVSFLPDFWFTHPLTSERMSEARLRADRLPKQKGHIDDGDFQILKWYVMVESAQVTEQQLQIFALHKNPAAQIALAAFYVKQGDYTQAQKMLDHLAVTDRTHNLVSLLQTDIYLGQNKLQQAHQTIYRLQQVLPENRAINYKLAEVLIRQNKPEDAIKRIHPFITKNSRDIEGWRLMQRASQLDRNNPVQEVNVLRYRAEVEFWSGYEQKAIKSMLHAQRQARGNQAISAKIDLRLKQMQDDYKAKI